MRDCAGGRCDAAARPRQHLLSSGSCGTRGGGCMSRWVGTIVVALCAVCAPSVEAATVTCQLQEVHGHRLDGSVVDRSWRVVAPTGIHTLGDLPAAELVGRTVTITDADPQTRVVEGRVRATAAPRVAVAAASGPQSVLVLIITTPDATTPAASPADVRARIFSEGGVAARVLRGAVKRQHDAHRARQSRRRRRAGGGLAAPRRLQLRRPGVVRARGGRCAGVEHRRVHAPHLPSPEFAGVPLRRAGLAAGPRRVAKRIPQLVDRRARARPQHGSPPRQCPGLHRRGG